MRLGTNQTDSYRAQNDERWSLMIIIRKLDHTGKETYRYEGEVLERGATWVRLEARFGGADRDAGYVMFRRGDRFVEWHYSDRWYNIFEMHDVSDDRLK